MALSEQEEFELLSLEREKSQFASTGGGAAVGNPNLQRQGDRALRPDVQAGEALAAIGGAGATGGIMGAAAPEILGAVATGVRALPFPGAPAVATGLDFAGRTARMAGRPISAIGGAVSGIAGETAGQIVEATGAPQPLAEAARFVGGGVGAETANAAKMVLQKYALVPALGLASKFKHEAAKKLLEKLQTSPGTLASQERELLDSITAEIRGGAKTDAPLENVGNIMRNEGNRLLLSGETQRANALLQSGSVGNAGGYPSRDRTLADIGGELQSTILARNKAGLEARSAQYTANEKMRDSIVAQREGAGQYVNDLPEYQSLIAEIRGQLNNAEAMKRSPTIQASYEKVLREITNPQKTEAEIKLVLSGRNLDFQESTGVPKPVTFKAIDDARRSFGEVFRGKPAQGFEAIDARMAEDVYAKLSSIQKGFAGGEKGPQAKLLDDYASATPGLEKFSSKLGKKVTALDQYREGQYPDPSDIPSAFFRTRASIQALKELTGNDKQVQTAALDFANKELAGKDAPSIRAWMSKNAEWLGEVPATRDLVNQYATRLADSERATRNSQEFLKRASADKNMLVGKGVPAQQAIDLIKSGDASKWAVIAPVIAKSPQAKSQMVSAVRQVVANEAQSTTINDLFNRNIRHFLEQSDIATKAEMDAVSKGLSNIQTMKIPEQMRLGMAKRIVLNSIGGYTAGAASRAAVGGFGLLSDMVPQ